MTSGTRAAIPAILTGSPQEITAAIAAIKQNLDIHAGQQKNVAALTALAALDPATATLADVIAAANTIATQSNNILDRMQGGGTTAPGPAPQPYVMQAVALPPAPAAPVPAPPAPAPTPAPTPAPPAYASRIQAEDATLNGVGVSTEIAGYEGTGHSAVMTTSGQSIVWTFPGVPAGTYDIRTRYFSYGPQVNDITVDAMPVDRQNESAGSWYVRVISGVTLAAGTHTVTATPYYGYTYYDWTEIVQTGVVSPAPTPAPSPSPAPAPAPGSPPYMPYGNRTQLVGGKYPYGLIANQYTQAQMDTMVCNCYDDWVANRLVAAPTFTPSSGILVGQTISTGYYVSNGGGVYSEGQGYGMLLTALFAGHDPQAQARFNGLLQVARGKPAYGMPSTAGCNVYTMDWTLDTSLNSLSGGGYSATDGDLDIALALFMADAQWGSAGTWNYKQQALNTVAALKAVEFSSHGEMLAPQNTSRTSDYMIGHYRTFKKFTGDTFWDTAISRCATLISGIISVFSASAHLTPGCIYDPEGTAAAPNTGPKPDNVTDFDHNGGRVQYYDQNANRNPMRWGVDYLFSGDATWGNFAKNINLALKADCGSDPTQTGFQYSLAGACMTSRYFAGSNTGPMMVGAMCDSAMQAWVNTLFYDNSYRSGGQAYSFKTAYYDCELQLLSLVIAAGCWWMP